MLKITIIILMIAARFVVEADSFMLRGYELIHDHNIMVLLHVLVSLCYLMHCTFVLCMRCNVSHAMWLLQAFQLFPFKP